MLLSVIGNTADFDSAISGSSPGGAAFMRTHDIYPDFREEKPLMRIGGNIFHTRVNNPLFFISRMRDSMRSMRYFNKYWLRELIL